jgi:serine/threonine protein kinase
MSGKQSVFGALGSIDGSPRGDQPIRIPGFELHQVLGMGAMGVVYRGEQLHPRRTVAVKVMRMSVDAGSAERIRREAITAGRCEHPCVVQVHAAGVLEAAGLRVPWIAMQYVDRGESLDRWASRVDREPGQVLACFELLADAMQHAHLRGVIHRDLKPSNILVDAGGRPRVIDFGLATHDDGGASLTEPGMLVGTLRYMAPEVLRGGRADVRSDIFALAVCLHECLVVRSPHAWIANASDMRHCTGDRFRAIYGGFSREPWRTIRPTVTRAWRRFAATWRPSSRDAPSRLASQAWPIDFAAGFGGIRSSRPCLVCWRPLSWHPA